MRQTILVCDLCRDPRTNAVATLGLTNGRGKQQAAIDVCVLHQKRVLKIFKPATHGPAPVLIRDPSSTTKDLDKKILAVLKGTMSAKEIQTKLSPSFHITTILSYLRGLIKAGKIKREGERKGTKYRKA